MSCANLRRANHFFQSTVKCCFSKVPANFGAYDLPIWGSQRIFKMISVEAASLHTTPYFLPFCQWRGLHFYTEHNIQIRTNFSGSLVAEQSQFFSRKKYQTHDDEKSCVVLETWAKINYCSMCLRKANRNNNLLFCPKPRLYLLLILGWLLHIPR